MRRIGLLCVLGLFSVSAIAETITLNLKNADINTLIATVADVTDTNFIIDPRVKGKVTVISKKPMDADEIYEVFLSILQVHGFAAVENGDIMKIVPDVNAKQSGIPLTDDLSSSPADNLVTRVIQVENVNAAQLVPILRPLVPQQGHLAAYTPTNVLIISDRAQNIIRLLDIISKMDQASNVEIEVIQLEHASATETVRVLQALEQQAAGQGQRSPGQEVKLISDERTNSILLTGDRASRLRIRGVIAHLDTPLESEGNTQVIYLRYASAKDLVPVLTGVSDSIKDKNGQKGAPASAAGKVNIQADETTNSLVITAPPDALRSLKAVIAQLDVRRAQVLVEAVIAEVSMSKESKLGIEWVGGSADGGIGILNFGATGLGNILAAAAGADGSSSGDNAAVAGALGSTKPGFTYGAAGGSSSSKSGIGALINVLAGDGNTNILSTPSIVTLDNEEAEIRIAENVPFVTGSFTNTGSGGGGATNPFQTVNREDVGLILKIKPQINEGSAIQLSIDQEVSSIKGSSASELGPNTTKRSIKTSVIVEDGQILVLGGLIEERLTEQVSKVPLLGDLPLLGHLFKSTSTNKAKTNLMIFLNPQIIRDAATSSALTSRKYEFIRAQQLMQAADGVSLMPGESTPVLEENFKLELPLPF